MIERFFIILVLCFAPIISVLAQSSLPPSSFGSINDLPINQGVVMALAAGVAYGLKKLNSRKKQ
ncbi:MAG: PID-CTERM protein-sorting domain-containing protein [Bacteroidota bacterium]|jgi:hypothetical protein|nr:hypothetical protein [Sphingobacteriales bacterium]